MDSFWQDLRYGLRMMARNPGVTAVAVLSLAIGVAANTVVFSFVNAFLFRPLPFRDPGRLVHLWESDPKLDEERLWVSLPDFIDWKQQSEAFTDLGVFNYTGETLSGRTEPERVSVGRVSANMFDLLGVQPVLGRGFLPGEDRPGNGQVVVLSDSFWRERFAADPRAIGQTLKLDGATYTVIGVMPPEFVFPLPITRLWAPRILDAAKAPRSLRSLQVVGRLKPGMTREKAQTEMRAIAARLAAAYPVENGGIGVNIVPLRDALNFASEVVQPMSVVLAVAAGFVLLISCANVSSLLLAQAVSRTREMAVRISLGGTRARLILQLLIEGALLSLLGGAGGILLSLWLVHILAGAIPPQLYRIGEIAVDASALGFALVLCLCTTVLFGLAPALQASRRDPAEALKQNAESPGVDSRRLRPLAVLVGCEIGLSCVLLICGALAAQSAANLQRVNLGFDPRSVLTMGLRLPKEKYSTEKRREFHRQLVQRVAELPQVQSAATVGFLPVNHEWDATSFEVEGQAPPTSGSAIVATTLTISPDYFSVMRIPVLRGRAFSAQDDNAARPAVIINQELSRRYFPGADATGRRLILKADDGTRTAVTILGVVADSRQKDLASATELQIYRPQFELPDGYFRLLVRTGADPLALSRPLRAAIWAMDGDLSITEVRTLDEVVHQFLLPQRSLSTTLFGMAASALVLATIGIYGVMAFSVKRRTRELGIRRALGAQSPDLIRLVLGRGLRLTFIGLGAGLAIALVMARLLQSLLFGITPADPLTFGGVSVLLAGVALAACYIPARRATRVDPMIALRYE